MPNVRLQFGNVLIAPSESEQQWAAVGAGVAALGWLVDSTALKLAGVLTIAGVGLSVFEEAQTFADPDLMNGFFQTDGQLSATRGDDQAAALRYGGGQ
jgi:hypothetical protein